MFELVLKMILLFLAPNQAHPINHDEAARVEIADQIVHASEKYKVDPAILTTRLFLESSFLTTAVGRVGEIGLSQIKDDGDCKAVGLFPKKFQCDNVMCAAFKIAKYKKKCGSYERSISHYVTGRCVNKHGIKKGKHTVRLAARKRKLAVVQP